MQSSISSCVVTLAEKTVGKEERRGPQCAVNSSQLLRFIMEIIPTDSPLLQLE
jgi:hypothetical protein